MGLAVCCSSAIRLFLSLFISFFSYISVLPSSDLDFTGLCVRYKLKVGGKHERKPTDRQAKTEKTVLFLMTDRLSLAPEPRGHVKINIKFGY